MKHNFTIDAELSIHPVEGFDNFTQNSVGTKYFAAKLDGWSPAQGEHLFVAFERKDGGNKLDPIFMGMKEEVYHTIMPREVMFDNGEWQACIYKKLNFNENTGKADAQETGEKFDFLVKRTIRDDSGNAVTQYDIVNLHSSAIDAVRRAEEAEKHVEGTASDSYDAARRAETAAQAAEQSKQEAEESAQASEENAEQAEQSALAAERSAEVAAQEALLSAHNEQKAAENAEEAATQALAAKQSAERAEVAAQNAAGEVREEVKEFTERAVYSATYAENAQAAAEEARDRARDYSKIAEAATSSGLRKVIVDSLPEEGSDNLIYLVRSGAATEDNYYDEYLWVADKETGKAKFEKIGTTRTDLMPYVEKTLLEETKEAIMAELANEATEREDHDSALGTAITAEVAAREGADEEISATLSEEISVRANADEDLENAIAVETTARKEADMVLNEGIKKNLYNLGAFDSYVSNDDGTATITRRTGYFKGFLTANVAIKTNYGARIDTVSALSIFENNNAVITQVNNLNCLSISAADQFGYATKFSIASHADGIVIILNGQQNEVFYVDIQYQLKNTYTEKVTENQPIHILTQQGENWLQNEWKKGLNLMSWDGTTNWSNAIIGGNIWGYVGVAKVNIGQNYTFSMDFAQTSTGQGGAFLVASDDGTIAPDYPNLGSLQYVTYEYVGNGKKIITFSAIKKYVILGIRIRNDKTVTVSSLMLNEGDHPYPYEPYNGKIVREVNLKDFKESISLYRHVVYVQGKNGTNTYHASFNLYNSIPSYSPSTINNSARATWLINFFNSNGFSSAPSPTVMREYSGTYYICRGFSLASKPDSAGYSFYTLNSETSIVYMYITNIVIESKRVL